MTLTQFSTQAKNTFKSQKNDPSRFFQWLLTTFLYIVSSHQSVPLNQNETHVSACTGTRHRLVAQGGTGGFCISPRVPFQVGIQRSPTRGELHGSRSCSDIYLGECGHMERDPLCPESEAFALFLPDAMSRVLGG